MDPVTITSLSNIENLPDDFFPEIEKLTEHAEIVLTPFLNNDSRIIHVPWRDHDPDLVKGFLGPTIALSVVHCCWAIGWFSSNSSYQPQ